MRREMHGILNIAHAQPHLLHVTTCWQRLDVNVIKRRAYLGEKYLSIGNRGNHADALDVIVRAGVPIYGIGVM